MSERQRLILIWLLSLPREPVRYQVTQPGDPRKSKRTWHQSMRVYLAARKRDAPTSTIPASSYE